MAFKGTANLALKGIALLDLLKSTIMVVVCSLDFGNNLFGESGMGKNKMGQTTRLIVYVEQLFEHRIITSAPLMN